MTIAPAPKKRRGALERLITQDKVDFILPPWGTGLNLAVGPILNKAGYPHLASTAVTDRAPELAKRWPNSFWLLGTSAGAASTLVDLLVKLRGEGKIGDTVAMVSVADGFGIDLSGAARPALAKANFKLAYDKTYPVGTQDLSPIVNEVKALNPDVFIAFSYPPDTLGITEQARIASFNPKIFYTGVGTAFPLFKGKFGANARRRDGDRRLERRQRTDQGLPGASQGGVGERRRAGSLGQCRDLRQPADAATGDRTRRQDRPRGRHQGPADRNVRHRDRQGQVREQSADQILVGRAVAGRRILRRRTGHQRRRARANRSEAGMEGAVIAD